MTHFQRRMMEIRGQQAAPDLFSCPFTICRCDLCALCGEGMHSPIHVGRGRLGSKTWRHEFRTAP